MKIAVDAERKGKVLREASKISLYDEEEHYLGAIFLYSDLGREYISIHFKGEMNVQCDNAPIEKMIGENKARWFMFPAAEEASG